MTHCVFILFLCTICIVYIHFVPADKQSEEMFERLFPLSIAINRDFSFQQPQLIFIVPKALHSDHPI